MLLRTARITVGALASGLVIAAVIMSFSLATVDGALDVPPVWALGLVVVAAVVLGLAVVATGYRTAPLTPGLSDDEVRVRTQTAFTGVVMRRAALCEAVGFVSLAIGIVTLSHGGFVVIVVGFVVALALVAVLGWPGERTVQQVAAQLERDGVRSGLRESLGLMPDVPGRTTL